MAFSAKAGNITILSTDSGNTAFTGVGFQPKAVIFFNSSQASTTDVTTLFAGFGVATSSTTRWAMGVNSLDGNGTSDCARVFDSTKCIRMTNSAGNTTLFAADFVSFDADGFTINVTTTPAANKLIGYVALGGTDLSAMAGTFDMPISASGNQTVSGVGFTPNFVLCGNTISTNTEGFATSVINMISAAASSSSRWVNTSVCIDAAAAANEDHYWSSTDFIWRGSSATPNHQADFVNFNSDGFVYNVTASTASAVRFGYLALAGTNVKLGVTTQGTTGVTGVGFTPSIALFTTPGTASASGTFESDSAINYGASDATNEVAMSAVGNDAADPTQEDTRFVTDKAITILTAGTPTLSGEADLTAFGSDGFTLSWTTDDTTARNIPYIALGQSGGAPTSSTTVINRMMLMGVS